MLTLVDQANQHYVIALSELSSVTELLADFSYLADVPAGRLVFDFTHTASNLTMVAQGEHCTERLSGDFGFHAVDHLIEQLSFIGKLREMPLLTCCPHEVSVILPSPHSYLGQFFTELGMFELMAGWDLLVETRYIWEPKGARDDAIRRVLIPLTDMRVDGTGLPNTSQMEEIRGRVVNELCETYKTQDAIIRLSEMIGGIIEDTARLVHGGLTAALYFPMTGYFELSMVNWTEGVIGRTPDEQLDALVNRLETTLLRFQQASERAMQCYGTFQLCNGFASILIAPDGSITTMTEHLGLPDIGVLGPRATVVLQLPPKSPASVFWEQFARERVNAMWKTISDWHLGGCRWD